MSVFEFVTVVISLLLALAIGQLLLGVAGLVKNRGRVAPSPPLTLWLVFLFLLSLSLWWSQYDFLDIEWTYLSFLYVVLGPTILFFLVALLVPDDPGGREVDLDRHFEAVRTVFLVLLLVYALVTWFDGPLLQGQPVLGPIGLVNVGFVAAILIALVVKHRRVQTFVPAYLILQMVAVVVIRLLPGTGR
jgi:hypothetical protein